MAPDMIERHDCRWETVAVKPCPSYDQPPRTSVVQRCVDCGLIAAAVLDGEWTVAEVTGPAMKTAGAVQ